ncbi:unnamed protein product, partial [Closterium sp. NIES-54]
MAAVRLSALHLVQPGLAPVARAGDAIKASECGGKQAALGWCASAQLGQSLGVAATSKGVALPSKRATSATVVRASVASSPPSPPPSDLLSSCTRAHLSRPHSPFPPVRGAAADVERPWRAADARLALEDGSVWKGSSFGARGTQAAEVVFNTSLTGYQEIITDPSYAGQIVLMTCPHIGNTGINEGPPAPRAPPPAFLLLLCFPPSLSVNFLPASRSARVVTAPAIIAHILRPAPLHSHVLSLPPSSPPRRGGAQRTRSRARASRRGSSCAASATGEPPSPCRAVAAVLCGGGGGGGGGGEGGGGIRIRRCTTQCSGPTPSAPAPPPVPLAPPALVPSALPSVSNWRSSQTLPDYLRQHNMMGICVISTDRKKSDEELVEMARSYSIVGKDLITGVTCEQPYVWVDPTGEWEFSSDAKEVSMANAFHVVAYDFGIKHNILRRLASYGCRITVVPSTYPPEDLAKLNPDGVLFRCIRFTASGALPAFPTTCLSRPPSYPCPSSPACPLFLTLAQSHSSSLSPPPPSTSAPPPSAPLPTCSNGPGDPSAVPYAVESVRAVVGTVPALGICMGHQLLGQALGGRTFKLKFGHHGGNHPVRHLASGRVEISAQNHNYAVDPESLPEGVQVTHINLNDGTCAGLAYPALNVISIQYHPESSPGPHDADP